MTSPFVDRAKEILERKGSISYRNYEQAEHVVSLTRDFVKRLGALLTDFEEEYLGIIDDEMFGALTDVHDAIEEAQGYAEVIVARAEQEDEDSIKEASKHW